jgi:hypothetical protein
LGAKRMINATVVDHEPVEDARVMTWASQIARGEMAEICAAFAATGAIGPTLIWRPGSSDLVPLQLRFLLEHWSRLKGERRFPLTTQIDALEMQPALGYIALLDPVDGGRDFRFRLFGTAIAAAAEFDLTGEMLSALRGGGQVADFEIALHRAVLARGEPAYCWQIPAADMSHAAWHRLVLPFANEAGEIIRLMTGVVAVPRIENRMEG